MWLFDSEAVWEILPIDGVRGTDLALKLLRRTQELLGDGLHWRDEALAIDREGAACDPLSEQACSFSLGGAAARARWEMREALASTETNPGHVRQVMNALFAMVREYREGLGDWSFVRAVLDGMKNALEQYREVQLEEVRISGL